MNHEKIWLSLAFFTFLLLFGNKIYNLIVEAIDKKIADITKALDEAQKLRDENENMLELAKEKLEKAEQDMQETVANAHQKVKELYNNANN
jgi:F0F1-type ATP synthase membrane subunit b/b'